MLAYLRILSSIIMLETNWILSGILCFDVISPFHFTCLIGPYKLYMASFYLLKHHGLYHWPCELYCEVFFMYSRLIQVSGINL
jgi:hypothetical protein